MPNNSLAPRVASDLLLVRGKSPLVHNITNLVVMNFTANALLAAGASPVMAHAREEVEEMVGLAGALVLNIGTLTPAWVESMLIAGRRANELGVPIVMDPVGAGATKLRTESARMLLKELSLTMVRGNASEIMALAGQGAGAKGVDSRHGVEEAADAAGELARSLKTPVAITGAVDLITDGSATYRVANGHPLMGRVTGMGCAATALIGAFLAVETNPLVATACALSFFGQAGEEAANRCQGPASFMTALLDALYYLTPEQVSRGARITS